MLDTLKTMWVTRNALKEGIREMEPTTDHGNGFLSVKGDSHIIGRLDWHLTREAALTRAHHLRDAKVQSLEREVERLRGMRFG